MSTRRTALRAGCALLLGWVGSRAGSASAAPGAYCPSAQEKAFLALINDFRKRHHKGALTLSAPLGAAARFHSQDMANRRRIKGHGLTNGDSALENMRRFGFTGNIWGENIAWEAPDAQTAFKWWKRSPEHRRNMLKGDFRAIGIGFYANPNSPFRYYWTTDFGDDGGAGPTC